jgi:hypothetical protein
MTSNSKPMERKIKEIKDNKGTFHVHLPFLAGDLLHFRAEFESYLAKEIKPTAERVRWTLPIIVSLFETFYKELFAKYIDIGDPYLGRIEKLHQQNKPQVSFDTLRGLSKKEFSIGDIYAYSFKYNSLSEIRKTYETICSCDYVEKIEKADFDFKEQDQREIARTKEAIRTIFPKLEKVFQMRHALIHEYPATNTVVELEELIGYLDSAWLLLMTTDRMFWVETKLRNPFFRN